MTQIRRARKCASFGIPCIAMLVLGVTGQAAGKVRTPQTIIGFAVAELFSPRPVTQATETTLASKRTKDLVIAITSSEGRLKGGENNFCVLFQKTATDEPVDVRNVRVDFTLLVGRIQEEPIKTQLTEDRVGRYCGHVNLGKQYYTPASYYAFVFYTDAAGRKKKERLLLSVR
jgi:hypothetical protein